MEVKSIKEKHTELMMQSVKFAKDEQSRRKGQEVLFKWPDIEKQLGEHKHIYVVDARLGSNNHTHRLWYDVIPPHTEDGQEWKSLGHRHTVEAIIYFLKGHGHSIIDGVRYDWGRGDRPSGRFFSWHRHVNDGDEPVLRIASTTGPLSLALGQAVYEDERYPEFWIYAQEGEDARKTLIPGGGGSVEAAKIGNNRAAEMYAEQVAFAMHEEQLRRDSKVLVKPKGLAFEPTAIG